MPSRAGTSPAPGSTVYDPEPPKEWRLLKLPQVVATPHIAASTKEAQEQVGSETAAALRDFLKEASSATPSTSRPCRPKRTSGCARIWCSPNRSARWSRRWARRASIAWRALLRRAGRRGNQLLGSAVLEGVLPAILVGQRHAGERAHRRHGTRHRADRIAQHALAQFPQPDLREAAHRTGERWVEGTVFGNGSLRLVLIDGVPWNRRSKARCSSSRTTISPASSATSARCSAAQGEHRQLRARS